MFIFGLAYLLICFYFGLQLVRLVLPDPQRLFVGIAYKKINLTLVPPQLFYYPAGFLVGLVSVSFFTYLLACAMNSHIPANINLLHPVNIISACLALYFGSLFWQKRYRRLHPKWIPPEEEEDINEGRAKKAIIRPFPPTAKKSLKVLAYTSTKKATIFYSLSLIFFFVAATYLFFYSFYISNGTLHAGYSIFSDFGPHTALVSSFAVGRNFPAQYPHFSGDGIRYHFLFFFICGNLQALGLPIDFAINLPSILIMVSCFCLLGVLGLLLFGQRLIFLLAPVLVLFRSSTAIISQIISLAQKPGANLVTAIQGILEAQRWIGDTPRDEWGLWSINVYANQRHLLLGVGLLLLLVFLFLPHLRRMFVHLYKIPKTSDKLTFFFFSRQAWLPLKKDPLRPFFLLSLAILTAICFPYFHGSALIAALLILAFMAVFSENRLFYLLLAGVAITSAFVQTTAFSGGAKEVISPGIYWGFLVEPPFFMNLPFYFMDIMGISALIVIFLLFFQRNAYRKVILAAFLLPLVFAFVVSLTADVTANHKFVQISLILVTIFVAAFWVGLWRSKPAPQKLSVAQYRDYNPEATPWDKPNFSKKSYSLFYWLKRSLAILLLLALMSTGISEWIIYTNINRNAITLNTKSALVSWIEKNTLHGSVFLTAPYSMNVFFLSGRFSFYGHPYYAWSAGHDTEGRAEIYRELLSGANGDIEKFRQLCRTYHISYVLVDNELRTMDKLPDDSPNPFDESFFQKHLKLAVQVADDSNTIVYSLY